MVIVSAKTMQGKTNVAGLIKLNWVQRAVRMEAKLQWVGVIYIYP